jgi:phosphatidylglycerol:prolipoprotein diacylglycerol transferase
MKLVFEPGVMTYGGNIRISQLLAILILLAAIFLIIYRRKKGYAKEHYSDPIVSSKASGEPKITADDELSMQGAEYDQNRTV